MKRHGKILALLMLLIYMTASAGSSAAALLCRHHCHHIHHSEECACEGYSFEIPCDGHHHVQYAGVYANRTEDSRQSQLLSFIVIPVIASGAADELVCPAVDDTGRHPLIDTPPLCKAHCRASALRAPPALV